jgi:site-specific DNA recombinase
MQYLARQESKQLSEVTIRGQLSSVRSGWWSGGMPPYGYDLVYIDPQGQPIHVVRFLESGEKSVLSPDGALTRTIRRGQRAPKGVADKARLVLSSPDRVALVREMFGLYANQNMGFKAIACSFNERGVLSPKNGKWSGTTQAGWSQSTVRSIIMNPLYTGDTVWNRRTNGKFHRIAGERAVERESSISGSPEWNDEADVVVVRDTHPAIIDRETFKKCRRLQQQRGKTHYTTAYRSGRGKTSPYLLSGLIKCSRCGHSYSGIPTTKGKARKDGSRVRTYYYTCGGYRSKGTAVCQKATLPRELIEYAILANIKSAVAGFLKEGGEELLRAIFQKCLESTEVLGDQLERCERRVGQINARIDELVESLTPTNKEFVDQKLASLKEERDDLTAHLDSYQKRSVTSVDIDSIVRDVIENIRRFDELFAEGTCEEQKELVSLFVEGIEVDPKEGRARVRIKRFPASKSIDAGNLLVLVAGARSEHQKIPFPPVDVVEIPLERRGNVLVPVAA